MLTPDTFCRTGMDEDQIIAWQRLRQAQFRAVPEAGQYVDYCGQPFVVFPTVFWPFEDSVPLTEAMEVRSGESVLDMGTGSGVIAVRAAQLGAKRVVAVDINPQALKAARTNAAAYGCGSRIEVVHSDVFDALQGQCFDVITANLPWLNRPAKDIVEASQWDTEFRTNTRFLREASRYLSPGGRLCCAQGNYGALDRFVSSARDAGWSVNKIASRPYSKLAGFIFYAFELRRRPGPSHT